MTEQLCTKCGGEMQPSKALEQTWKPSLPDFLCDPLDRNLKTMQPGGPGNLIDCLKCVDCGWSMRIGT
jgi:hypothetical protein